MIGVIGGSGFYELLTDAEPRAVPTPYGEPSAVPTVGLIDGIEVAFIPRHGKQHQFPPHLVPYRANAWAMRELGVDRLVSTTAVGSIHEPMEPGHFVVPDQVVDRTWGRASTFFDGPEVRHLSFADPYHQPMRQIALEALQSVGATAHDGATVVVVPGPRFSTRAESESYVAAGWHLLNMTQMPEVALSSELGICVANVSVVTDYDFGVKGAEPVTHQAVLEQFARSVDVLKRAIQAMVGPLSEADIGCDEAT